MRASVDASVRAAYDARLEALRDEVHRELGKDPLPAGTSGETTRPRAAGKVLQGTRAQMVAEIKEELQSEMGLLPVHLLRERRSSFVELYADDNLGKTNYGTAGYLGGGYFVTVKHAVVALKDDDNRQGARKIVAIKIVHNGKDIPAKLVDAGNAEVEVDSGDWAIIKTPRRSICRRSPSTPRLPTISPNRFSASATTTPRASSSRPATSARRRRAAWSRA